MKQSQRDFTILTSHANKDSHINLKLVLSILVNGKVASAMDLENRHGLTVLNTQVNGEKTELTAREDLFMSTVIFMTDIGLMIKLTVVESINM